jgi:hypothetical protein
VDCYVLGDDEESVIRPELLSDELDLVRFDVGKVGQENLLVSSEELVDSLDGGSFLFSVSF